MAAVLKTLSLLLFAAVLAILAALVPTHVRSVDQAVVEWFGANGQSSGAKVWEVLNAAHIGPAEHLLIATQIDGSELDEMTQRRAELLAAHPDYRLSGGPSPVFESFLENAHPNGLPLNTPNAILSMLLPRSERALLSAAFENSSNANVTALLGTRTMGGLIQLHPANHAAGAPYDAGVLTLALLVQGDYFDPALSQQLGILARDAAQGNGPAIRAYESFAVATLSLGRRLDFRSLASLAEITSSLDDWAQMAELFRARPEAISQLYTTLRFSREVPPVYDYFAEHSETAARDLKLALRNGPDATNHLLHSEQAVFQPRSLLADGIERVEPYRPEWFTELSASSKALSLLLKFALFALSGLLFAFAMGAAWRGSTPKDAASVSRHNPAVLARDAFISIVVALTLWTLAEPDVLKSPEGSFDSAPRIEFAVADTLQSLKSPVKAMQDLNQVTLLVLALFFIVQLVIYCFCLIKLREIAKQSLSANLKLRLLENEDQLFDFGLYVGLGGTVLSLILVAVGIVEASLMAAYASTLFGIIFVALLKVLHLRPYRRKLILEAGSDTGPQSPLMKDIEL